MVDEPEPEPEVVMPDPSGWDDAQWNRAVALMVFDAEVEDVDRFDDGPNYDW